MYINLYLAKQYTQPIINTYIIDDVKINIIVYCQIKITTYTDTYHTYYIKSQYW